MVGTIIPIVYGERENHKPPAALWLYVLGNIAGGALLGGLSALLGLGLRRLLPPLDWQALPVLGAGLVGLLASAHELQLLRLPFPQFRRQVPSRWRLLLPPRLTALLYGLGLGVGVATRITAVTFHVVVVWACLAGDVLLGSLTLAVFGLGRTVPVLVAVARQETILSAHERTLALGGWEVVIHLVNGLCLALVGAWLLAGGWLLT